MSWSEFYHFPVPYRLWLIKRINQELDRTKQAGQVQSKALHDNTPDIRSMLGRQRTEVPSRHIKFT